MGFYNSLRPYRELKDCYLVHTGFLPGVDIREQRLEDMIWIRKPFIHSTYDFGKRVIFGRTPLYEPLVMENKIGLRTGAVYGLRLTCLDLPEMRFHSIEA
jgi:serine/threonine protein phosphatase 1